MGIETTAGLADRQAFTGSFGAWAVSGKHSMATALAWPLTLSHEGGGRWGGQDDFPLSVTLHWLWGARHTKDAEKPVRSISGGNSTMTFPV